MKRFRHIADETGTSIIEILVVMVILLVGIMSVVRLFPGGFLAVRHAESITFANRIAQAEIERLKNYEENLPAGILPVDFATGTVWNDQYPGPPFKATLNGANNVDSFRRIIGETTKIPVGTYFGATNQGIDFGSVYSLIFSPVATDSVRVYGGTWRRQTMILNQSPESLKSFEYGIDYGEGNNPEFYVCFRPEPFDRVFRVSFSWWESSAADSTPELKSDAVEVHVAAGDRDWITVNVPAGNFFHEIEEYSDSVARAFNPVVHWSDDVYEYKVVDYDTGVIAFNPRGNNAVEYTVDGTNALEAHIDYDIYDLKILREDKIVPSDLSDVKYRVKLSLRFIKKAGSSTETDGKTYYGFTLPSGKQKDLVILDLNSGWRIVYPQPAIDVNYNDGIISFDAQVEMEEPTSGAVSTVPIAGRNIRVFYQAENDWRVIVHKSYELYQEGGSADYCHYAHRADSSRIDFAACDIGKNVSIDYTYLGPDPMDSNQTIEHRVVGETHQVRESGNASSGYAGYIDLDHNPTRITAVYGTSLKVRVLWVEGGSRTRPRYQWVDADTTLTRKPYEI